MSSNAQVPSTLDDLMGWYDDRFVRGTYLFVLGRPADAGGFSFYLKRVRDGVSRWRIVAELASSDEAESRQSASPGLQALVRRYRRRYSRLGRIRALLRDDVFSESPQLQQLRRIENAAAALLPAVPHPTHAATAHARSTAPSVADPQGVVLNTEQLYRQLRKAVKG